MTREKLTSDRPFYISPSGADANAGWSPYQPKRTFQAVWNHICRDLDLNGRKVPVFAAPGSYPDNFYTWETPLGAATPDAVTLQGDPSEPWDAAHFNPNNGAAFDIHGARLALQHLKITAPTCVAAFDNCYVIARNMGVGAASIHFASGHYAFLAFEGDNMIAGNAQTCIVAQTSSIVAAHFATFSYLNNPVFGINMDAQAGAQIYAMGMTFNNKATVSGKRFRAIWGGLVETGTLGADLNYLPGTIAGETIIGGIEATRGRYT